MKQFWLLVFVSVSLNSLGSQEVKHAPTVEQCRADQTLWLSKLMDWYDPGNVNISYRELVVWSREMGQCEQVDPEFRDRYRNTFTVADYDRLSRLQRFLDRHNLWHQFLAEDAQGKR